MATKAIWRTTRRALGTEGWQGALATFAPDDDEVRNISGASEDERSADLKDFAQAISDPVDTATCAGSRML